MATEHIIASHKANVDAIFVLGSKAFEGVEKLAELNLQVAKTVLGEAAQTTLAALSVKDAQELVALLTDLLKSASEKAAAYARHVYEIAAATSAEFGKAAEAGAGEAQKEFLALVDASVKSVPTGTTP